MDIKLMAEILKNSYFQITVIPLLLAAVAHGLYLLGKRGNETVTATDFAHLPYTLGTAAIVISATFVIASPSTVGTFYGWSMVLMFIMILMSIIQRFVDFFSDSLKNYTFSVLSILLVAMTYSLWN